jgi:hypothetical protein
MVELLPGNVKRCTEELLCLPQSPFAEAAAERVVWLHLILIEGPEFLRLAGPGDGLNSPVSAAIRTSRRADRARCTT